METRIQWDELYNTIKEVSINLITKLFDENFNFTADPQPDISRMRLRQGRYRLKLIHVIHKYYLNATVGKHVYPTRHWIQIIQVCLFLIFRKKRVKKILSTFTSIYFDKMRRLQPLIPEISFSNYQHQAFKIILACVLNTFINQPFMRRKSRLNELINAYWAGLYIGITYAVSDVSLDTDLLAAEEKDEFNELVLSALSNSSCETASANNILKFVPRLKSESQEFVPFPDFEYTYKIMYLLEKVQYEEMQFQPDYLSIDAAIYKTMLLALKTQFSLMAMRLDNREEILDSVKSGLIWSLYSQLDDDLRDVRQDLNDHVRTFFTLQFDHRMFNPHALMLYLINRLSKRYKAGWMFGEYLEHIARNETGNIRSLDNDKIYMFIGAITGNSISGLFPVMEESPEESSVA